MILHFGPVCVQLYIHILTPLTVDVKDLYIDPEDAEGTVIYKARTNWEPDEYEGWYIASLGRFTVKVLPSK
jgi:hypothetical protein